MEIKQTQTVEVKQALFTKLQMRQAFLILTLPVDELASFLMEELDQNPLFEFESIKGNNKQEELFEELSLKENDYTHIEEIVFEEAEPKHEFEVVFKETSFEELMKQFKEYTQDPHLIAEGEKIIGNLDKRGILNGRVSSTEALAIAHEIGVGFTSIRQMFLYQLKNQKDSPAYDLVKNHWHALEEKDFAILRSALSCPLLSDAKEMEAPTPTFDLEIDENFRVKVNDEPFIKFRLNLDYYNHPDLKKQSREAKWILRNLKVRTDFLTQLGHLISSQKRPLNVQESAEKLSIHPSTLYRSIKNKYISTPEGIFPLSRFFKKQQSVEERIVELVLQEEHPLTDKQLHELLINEGFKVARRTISYYRKLLNIPSSRTRGVYKTPRSV